MAVLAGAPARADDEVAKTPRSAVTIGGASVVLVAQTDKMIAFVDQLDNNEPSTDAMLSVALADGSKLKLERVADGMFVAPFSRVGHMQDAFMVSLKSDAGTGDAAAEITYDDVKAPEAAPVAKTNLLSGDVAISLVSGAVGAALATAVMLVTRRRRTTPSTLVGPVRVA